MMRLVGAERDGHGDGTWSNCERQCERVEGAAENIVGIHFFLDFWAAVPFLFAFEHGPAIRNDDETDRKSTRLNSSHLGISYAVFCLKKKNGHVANSAIDNR